ncbi:MAG: hypothetical protein ACFFCP_17770 [Promethearchaeota archaeon]
MIAEVDAYTSEHPNAPVDIQTISEMTGVFGAVVKQVFFVLLSLRLLKATFIPRHRICGHVVGAEETSVKTIQDKAANGEYWCTHCGEPIESSENVEAQIVFWKPGAHIRDE